MELALTLFVDAQSNSCVGKKVNSSSGKRRGAFGFWRFLAFSYRGQQMSKTLPLSCGRPAKSQRPK